ncbi:hypothetical protein [Asticcacaulis taihuensis]|uniref:hypothetical protein n=1 Tax=Asticcacaulis taihuensis TaxID=260084 RepID=UPI0026F35FAC|nr:hypothetical protein [Asticcacaulis taihuensis]
MFKPNMEAIRDWVKSGAMASDLDQATRDILIRDHPDLLKAFSRTFSTTEGRRVLDYIADQTILRPPADYTLPAGQALAYAHVRQGQNQIFALITELQELGDNLERNPHGPEQPAIAGSASGPDSDGGAADGWSSFDTGGGIAV